MREKKNHLNCFLSLKFVMDGSRLLKIPCSGALSEDKALLSFPRGKVPGQPSLDLPVPPDGVPVPRLLHRTGLSQRWVHLSFADRLVNKQQQGAINCPVQARDCESLWAAEQNQPGCVWMSHPSGFLFYPQTSTPEHPLPPALWHTAGLWFPGRDHAFL